MGKKSGKIPKKPEEVRLSKRITTATTEKLKEEVKEKAKEEDKSVSQFVRLSIRDKVYAETHPEADLKDLVEDGHETFSYVRGHRSEKEVSKVSNSNKNANVVPAFYILTALGYLQPLTFKNKGDNSNGVVRIDFNKDNFDLTFSSGDVTESVVSNKYHGDLHLFLNFKVLHNLLSNISPSSDLRFELDGDEVKVHVDNKQIYKIKQSFSNVKYLNYSDIKNDKNAESFIISSSVLRDLLQSTEYAMDITDNSAFPYVNGMEMIVNAQMFYLVATDRYRLAYTSYFPLPDTVLNSHRVFVPSVGVYALIKLLKTYGNGEKVNVVVNNGRLAFRVKRKYYDVDLVVGNSDIEYPDFKRAFPTWTDRDIKLRLKVKADTLYKALKEIATHCDKNRELVVIEWHKGYDSIKLIVKNSAGNRAEQSVLVSVEKDNLPLTENVLRAGFNPYFLMEPLKLWSTNGYGMNIDHLVDIDFTILPSLVIVPTGEDLKAFTVIMPIRITKNDY